MAKLEITSNSTSPFGTKVYLDGQEVNKITSLSFNIDVGECNKVTMELLVDEIHIDSEVEARFTFKKGISEW